MESWVAAHAWAAYLAVGVLVGFAAGLLGIGGGMIMVPPLVYVLGLEGFPPRHAVHVALATALATIVFTSLASVRAHHGYGSVDWRVARAMAPGILVGAFCAALLAGLIPTRPLAVLFTVLVFCAATSMLLDLRPKSTRPLPAGASLFGAGAMIGGVSSLLSAGGAFLSIPFLAGCGVPLRRAIGTAAAIGFPIAAAGTAAHLLQGLRVAGLPAGTVGYVYMYALGPIVATSMVAAPLGAKLAHRLPVKRLRVVFAALLYAMAARMLASVW
jgi:uncharacterized membrane protein YfcA